MKLAIKRPKFHGFRELLRCNFRKRFKRTFSRWHFKNTLKVEIAFAQEIETKKKISNYFGQFNFGSTIMLTSQRKKEKRHRITFLFNWIWSYAQLNLSPRHFCVELIPTPLVLFGLEKPADSNRTLLWDDSYKYAKTNMHSLIQISQTGKRFHWFGIKTTIS